MKRSDIRKPAVAGLFYPGDRETLYETLKEMDQTAVTTTDTAQKYSSPPKALIVPHAGYIYSGQIAATAYALLRPFADQIKEIVLMGPAHRVYLQGLALPTHKHFSTPLGDIPINQQGIDTLLTLPYASHRDDAHRDEHCLEVQLPFLQYQLGRFTLTPIIAGDIPPIDASQALRPFLHKPDTLIIISSDLSHFLTYDAAHIKDRETCKAITSLSEPPLSGEQACGCTPINALTHIAREEGYKITTLALCNSGDTAGTRDRVVGYGAWRMD